MLSLGKNLMCYLDPSGTPDRTPEASPRKAQETAFVQKEAPPPAHQQPAAVPLPSTLGGNAHTSTPDGTPFTLQAASALDGTPFALQAAFPFAADLSLASSLTDGGSHEAIPEDSVAPTPRLSGPPAVDAPWAAGTVSGRTPGNSRHAREPSLSFPAGDSPVIVAAADLRDDNEPKTGSSTASSGGSSHSSRSRLPKSTPPRVPVGSPPVFKLNLSKLPQKASPSPMSARGAGVERSAVSAVVPLTHRGARDRGLGGDFGPLRLPAVGRGVAPLPAGHDIVAADDAPRRPQRERRASLSTSRLFSLAVGGVVRARGGFVPAAAGGGAEPQTVHGIERSGGSVMVLSRPPAELRAGGEGGKASDGNNRGKAGVQHSSSPDPRGKVCSGSQTYGRREGGGNMSRLREAWGAAKSRLNGGAPPPHHQHGSRERISEDDVHLAANDQM